jgi:hypothetical protein
MVKLPVISRTKRRGSGRVKRGGSLVTDVDLALSIGKLMRSLAQTEDPPLS